MERWDRLECEKRYVEGEKISLEELSRISQVPYATLKKWRTKYKWVEARDAYQSRLASETREKTIQKTSDRLSDELSELAVEHLEAYRVCRNIATIKGKYVLAKLEKVFQEFKQHPEVADELASEFADAVQERALADLDVAMLNLISLVIDRSVRGERLSAGLEYDDINKAIARVEQTGLKVVADDSSIIAKLATGQVRQEN